MQDKQDGFTAARNSGTVFLNRENFEYAASLAFKYIAPFSAGLAFLYLVADGYDVVADPQWEAARDSILKGATRLLRSKLPSGFVMYLGGGAFGILATDVGADRLEDMGHAILSGVSQLRTTAFQATSTFQAYLGGITLSSRREVRDLLSLAEIAARIARQKLGRKIHIVRQAEEELLRWQDDLLTTTKMNAAILHGRFVLYRQALVPLTGMEQAPEYTELTARMSTPEGEYLPPHLLHVSNERFGDAARLDRYQLEKVIQSLGEWRDERGPLPSIFSICLTNAAVLDASMSAHVERLLARHGVPARCICLEIAERSALEHIKETTRFMRDIHPLGVKIALGDFGGRSLLLGRIAGFSVDYLKVSRELVNGLTDRTHRDAARAIHAISGSLGMKTIAQGVSDLRNLEQVRAAGFDYAQVEFIHRPEPWDVEESLHDGEAGAAGHLPPGLPGQADEGT